MAPMMSMKDVEQALQAFLRSFIGSHEVFARHVGSHFRVYSYESNVEVFLPAHQVVAKLDELGYLG